MFVSADQGTAILSMTLLITSSAEMLLASAS